MTAEVRKPRIDTLGLVTASGIAEMFGVTRIRINQIKHVKGFPSPVYDDGNAVLWRRDDARHWGMDNGYIRRF